MQVRNPIHLLAKVFEELEDREIAGPAAIMTASLVLGIGGHFTATNLYDAAPDEVGAGTGYEQRLKRDSLNKTMNALSQEKNLALSDKSLKQHFDQKVENAFLSLLDGNEKGAVLSESETERLSQEIYQNFGTMLGASDTVDFNVGFGRLDECIVYLSRQNSQKIEGTTDNSSVVMNCLKTDTIVSTALHDTSFGFGFVLSLAIFAHLLLNPPNSENFSEKLEVFKRRRRRYTKIEH